MCCNVEILNDNVDSMETNPPFIHMFFACIGHARDTGFTHFLLIVKPSMHLISKNGSNEATFSKHSRIGLDVQGVLCPGAGLYPSLMDQSATRRCVDLILDGH